MKRDSAVSTVCVCTCMRVRICDCLYVCFSTVRVCVRTAVMNSRWSASVGSMIRGEGGFLAPKIEENNRNRK